jgi:O-antigen/teichoic acid export membrane protein
VALLALVDVVTAAGLPQALSPLVASRPGARVPIARIVRLRLSIALPLFLCAQAATALLDGSLAFFIRVTSVAWLGVALDLDWFLVARGRVLLAAASRAFAALVRLALVVGLVRSSGDSALLPVAWASSVFVAMAGTWTLAWRRRLLHSDPDAPTLAPPPGRESWEFLSGELAVYAFTQGDRILLYALAGAEPTGLYHAAQRLVQPVQSVSTVVLATLYRPLASTFQAARAAGGRADSPALRAVLTRYFALMLYGTVPVGAFTLLFASPVVGWLYGSAYAPAAPVLALCGVAVTASFVAGSYVLPLKAWGISRGFSRAVIVTFGVQVVCCAALVPIMGARGAAVAALLAMIAASIAGRSAFRAVVAFAAGWAFVAPAAASLAAALSAGLAWRAGPLPAMAAFTAGYALAYPAAQAVVRRIAR